MQFLVVFSRSEVGPQPGAADREAETELIRKLYAEGIARQMWLRAEGGACMIAESSDVESLAAKVAELPLVRSGFLETPRISALKPYPGFGPRSV